MITGKKLFKALLIPCMAAAFAASACANNAVPGNTPEPTQLEQNTPAPSEAADTALPGAAPTVVPTQKPTVAPTEDPTEAPTAEPVQFSEEVLKQEGWKIAERIAKVHEIVLDSESWDFVYPINVNGIKVYEINGFNGLSIHFKDAPSETPELSRATIALNFNYIENVLGGYEAWYMGFDFSRWHDEFDLAEIVLTADEIRASGCTSTTGSDYLDAVGRLYAEKIARHYTDAPENCPMKCYEAQVLKVERSLNAENSYYVELAFRPCSIAPFYIASDYYAEIITGDDYPDHFGWIKLYGNIQLTPHEDGSWSGNAMLINAY